MARLRIAHTAAVHLDASATVFGATIRNAQGVNLRWADRVRCLRAFAEGAVARQADLAVIAGDLFDNDRPTPAEYLAAIGLLDPLAQTMPVVISGDNHGLTQSAFEVHAIEPLTGRGQLTVVTRPEVLTLTIAGAPVQVAVLPSPRRSALVAKDEMVGVSPQEVLHLVSCKLARVVAGLRAQMDPALPSLLVAHVMVQGSDIGPDPTASYLGIALPPAALVGFDNVDLGDVHTAQDFLDGRARYPGSLDRKDAGEERDAKGWLCVDLAKSGAAPAALSVEVVPSPARRFVTLEPDELADSTRLNEALTAPLDTVPAYRVKGRMTVAEYEALRPLLALWQQLPMFADKIEVTRETRPRNPAMRADLSTDATLRQWAQDNGHAAILDALLDEHRRLAESLNA